MDPSEENLGICRHQNAIFNYNNHRRSRPASASAAYANRGIRSCRIDHENEIKKDPPSSLDGRTPFSSGRMAVGATDDAAKKRQSLEAWVTKQQEQRQVHHRNQQQRDGNASILTDEMSEVQQKSHLHQKSQQPAALATVRRFTRDAPTNILLADSITSNSTSQTRWNSTSVVCDQKMTLEEGGTDLQALTSPTSITMIASSSSYDEVMKKEKGMILPSVGGNSPIGIHDGDGDSTNQLSEQSTIRSHIVHIDDSDVGPTSCNGLDVATSSDAQQSSTARHVSPTNECMRRCDDKKLQQVYDATLENEDDDSNSTASSSTLFLPIDVRIVSPPSACKAIPFLSKSAPASSDINDGSHDGIGGDLRCTISKKVSFDEVTIESPTRDPERGFDLEGKLSYLLHQQRQLHQQVERKKAINASALDDGRVMILPSSTFDSSFSEKSSKSSALASYAANSVQLSIESECVRQNTQISEMMECLMKDFFVATAIESNYEHTVTPNVVSNDQTEERQIHVQANQAMSSSGMYCKENKDIALLNGQKNHDPSHHLVIQSPSPKSDCHEVIKSSPKSARLVALPSLMSGNKDLAKFLVQFSDHLLNGCSNNYDTDSSDVFFVGNSEFSEEEGVNRSDIISSDPWRNQMLVNNANAPPHVLTRSMAFGRVASSISEGSDEDDLINTFHPFEQSKSLPNLPPASTFLSAKERARIRQHDTTPLRTNTSHSQFRKFFHIYSDGDISMASIREEEVEEDSVDGGEAVADDSTKFDDDKELIESISEPNGSKENASNISLGIASSNPCDHYCVEDVNSDSNILDTSSNLCDDGDNATNFNELNAHGVRPFQFQRNVASMKYEPVDPPSNDTECSLKDNVVRNQPLLNDSVTDMIKTTYREKQKGHSLAWHSTNGVNDDELHDSSHFPRLKVTSVLDIAGRSRSISSTDKASKFLDHASAYKGEEWSHQQLCSIKEMSFEGTDISDEKISSYRDSSSLDGSMMDNECVQPSEDKNTETLSPDIEVSSSSSSLFETSASSTSDSRSSFLISRSPVQNLLESIANARPILDNVVMPDARNKKISNDLPPIIRFDKRHNTKPPPGGAGRAHSKILSANDACTRQARLHQPTVKDQFSRVPSSKLHPHHVPRELTKSKLEELLRGNSRNDNRVYVPDANNSVGTSELGSLFTQKSDKALNTLPVPSVVVHHSYPRLGQSLSKIDRGSEFTGVDVSSYTMSLLDSSKASSCTSVSDYQLRAGHSHRLVNQLQTNQLDEAVLFDETGDTVVDKSGVFDIGEIIDNFKAAGSTFAKISENLFESTAVHGVTTRPSRLFGNRVAQDTSMGNVLSNSGHHVVYGANHTDSDVTRVVNVHNENIIGMKKLSSNNVDDEQHLRIRRKIDEERVRSFWNQLIVDDELSMTKAEQQQQQQERVLAEKTQKIAAALGTTSRRKFPSDASASHHSSIFEAFEVAPLNDKLAYDSCSILDDLFIHHSLSRPGSLPREVVLTKATVGRVPHEPKLQSTSSASRPPCHSASTFGSNADRLRTRDTNITQRPRNTGKSAVYEARSSSLSQYKTVLDDGKGPLRNDKKSRQSIRGGWKKIVTAGPTLGTVRTHSSVASFRRN